MNPQRGGEIKSYEQTNLSCMKKWTEFLGTLFTVFNLLNIGVKHGKLISSFCTSQFPRKSPVAKFF